MGDLVVLLLRSIRELGASRQQKPQASDRASQIGNKAAPWAETPDWPCPSAT